MIENIRQGDENQVRALSGETPNAKQAGKIIRPTVNATNIQDCHIDRFTQQGATLTNVASKIAIAPMPRDSVKNDCSSRRQ